MENISRRVVGVVRGGRGTGVLAALLSLPRVWRTVSRFMGVGGRVRGRPRALGRADILDDAAGVLYAAPRQAFYLRGGDSWLAVSAVFCRLYYRPRRAPVGGGLVCLG